MQVSKTPFTKLNRLALLTLALIFSAVSFAQETKKVEIDINAGGDNGGFFASPWVWVVGAAVFILLLVALLRGGSRRGA